MIGKIDLNIQKVYFVCRLYVVKSKEMKTCKIGGKSVK